MDKETAKYIVTYFFNLLPDKEKLAWKHHSSLLKLEDNNNPKTIEMYKRKRLDNRRKRSYRPTKRWL